MKKQIMIMAGGTGGHVFPAMAVAQEMLERGWQVSWLGSSSGMENRLVPTLGIEMDTLKIEGIRGKGLSSKFSAAAKLILACLQAGKLLRRRTPNVVLGMGGFVAGPGGLMAKLLGIPLVIHEQNRVPGTTNRILVKVGANKILEAFPDSFPAAVQAVCTGNPLRKELSTSTEKDTWHAQSTRALRILILGGSQGAKVLNELLPETLSGFSRLEVLHQTGQSMHSTVQQHYQNLGMKADIQAFINDMASAYHWADLIICRAGAMTVSEVSACGLPAIFIPFQHAIDDHQTANARYLTAAGAAILLPQTELSIENLRQKISQALNSLPSMSKATQSLARLDATKTVADICIAEAKL